MEITRSKIHKKKFLIYKILTGVVFTLLIGTFSVVWAQPRPEGRHPQPYYHDQRYEYRGHDREWYVRHKRYYRRYPPPPVYAPPPVVYGPPPPPPGISIFLPPIIIR